MATKDANAIIRAFLENLEADLWCTAAELVRNPSDPEIDAEVQAITEFLEHLTPVLDKYYPPVA